MKILRSRMSAGSLVLSLQSACCFLAALFPKVFCTATLTWALYVLLFIIHPRIDNTTLSSILSVVGTLLYLLSVYTYYLIIMAGAGSPLDYEELKITRLNSTNPYSENDDSSPTDSETGPLITSFLLDNPPLDVMDVHNFGRGGYRYCLKCSVWKPDRSHHCSNENRCVLRMDHHCPWFSVCIGFKNQKFFVQFLFYVSLFCTYLMIISTVLVYYFIRDKSYLEEHISINLVVLLVLSFAFSFSVSIFAGFLAYLVLKNQTTIEFQALRFNSANDSRNKFHYEFDLSVKKLGNIYDLGYYKNWTSIMGEKWYLWIFPIGITSDKINDTYRNGINFTVDEEVYEKWCDNAKLQDQLNQQLAEYKKKKSSEIREPLM